MELLVPALAFASLVVAQIAAVIAVRDLSRRRDFDGPGCMSTRCEASSLPSQPDFHGVQAVTANVA
jgi:hypothetical protein